MRGPGRSGGAPHILLSSSINSLFHFENSFNLQWWFEFGWKLVWISSGLNFCGRFLLSILPLFNLNQLVENCTNQTRINWRQANMVRPRITLAVQGLLQKSWLTKDFLEHVWFMTELCQKKDWKTRKRLLCFQICIYKKPSFLALHKPQMYWICCFVHTFQPNTNNINVTKTVDQLQRRMAKAFKVHWLCFLNLNWNDSLFEFRHCHQAVCKLNVRFQNH